MNVAQRENQIRQELLKELDGDLSIYSIIEYLQDKARVSRVGRWGSDTPVNKEALRLAAVYLEDLLGV